MNDTSQIIDVAAIGRTFSEQLAYISANPPKAGALIYLLPPCLALIAIDVATRLSKRPKIALEDVQAAAHEEEVQRLVARVRDALAKFQALEKKLSSEKARSQHLACMLRKQQNFTLHRQRLSALKNVPETDEKAIASVHLPMHEVVVIRDPFHAFCERLILQNRIWEQQREVRRLRDSLTSIRENTCSNAFQAFCERLLLSNKIWAQQKAVDTLVDEAEVLKRSRTFVVARAAKQMALDVEKERLTEDFVKELIQEVEVCREAIVSLRSEHEHEVQELAEDWRKECRRLTKEVERLELSRDAHLVEQELSNEQEQELIERLALHERKFDAIHEEFEEDQTLTDIEVPDENHIDDTDNMSGSEFDRMSTMSNTSTSTCVASAGGPRTPNDKAFGARPRRLSSMSSISSISSKMSSREKPVPLPPLKLVSRRQSMSIILSPSASSASSANSPVHKLEAGPYAGFSFNPLFFGNPSNSAGEPSDGASSSGRVRTYSLQAPLQHERIRTYSLQPHGKQPKRAQWRL